MRREAAPHGARPGWLVSDPVHSQADGIHGGLVAGALNGPLGGLFAVVEDFDLLVSLGVFNPVHMDQAIFAFRRYEDSSLSYAGIDSHEDLRKYGGFDTVVAKEL